MTLRFRFSRIWHHPMGLLALAVLLFVGLGSIGMYALESDHDISSWPDAIWYSFVTMTTVGYGDLFPKTGMGRALGIVLMVLGVGVLGMFTANVASLLVEKAMNKDEGLEQIDDINHYLVCGWNSRAEQVVDELVHRLHGVTTVVVVADIEHTPVHHHSVRFVQGDSTDERVLRRANVHKAKAALILSADTKGSSADASAVLTVLTIESINSDVYTCVELQDETNAQHCRRANADEILVSGHMTSKLLASSILDPGSAQVLSELATGSVGNSLYRTPVAPDLVGSGFDEALALFRDRHNAVLLAVQHQGRLLINPKSHTMATGDHLFVIAERPPKS